MTRVDGRPRASLHTARLRLDPLTGAHTELIATLSAMPLLIRFIGTGEPWSRRRAEEVAAAKRAAWSEHGFGWRAAIETATDRPIGIMAASLVGDGAPGVDPAEHEIGWWVDPAHWGRGLAREGAAAIRDELFATVGAPSVVARIQPANTASIRVAEAVGLTFDRTTVGRWGEPIAVYRLAAADWRP
jgi:RimJ/RimL family protein N-acetyltransferase